MNRSVPLWMVICLLVIALLPSVYLIGIQQNQRQILVKPKAKAAGPSANNASPATPLSPLKFTHFRVGNKNVKSILADDNILWVGTSGGVVRYDIAKDDFKLFDVNNKTLLSNGIFHLSKLEQRLLIGTYGGGLTVYDPEKDYWKNYNIPDGLADQFVYDVEKLANGDLWIATWSGVNRVRGAELDKPDHWQTFNKANTQGGLPNDWVYGVESDSTGALWFATEEGVAKFADGQWQNWRHQDGLGAAYELVKDDLQFSNDPAATSRHHAQQKIDQGMARIQTAFNPNYVVSLEITAKDVVWAGTWGGGLARFNGQKWRNYTTQDGLPSNHVFTLFQDVHQQLWVGTSHGLARYRDGEDKFTVLTRKHGLFADNVFALSMAADGSLWVGSFGGVAHLHTLPE